MKIASRPAALVLALLLAGVAAAQDDARSRALHDLDRILRDAGSTEQRADRLAELAWLDPDVSPDLAEVAREKLASWGRHALPALRGVIRRVPAERQAEVVTTLITAYSNISSGVPQDYLPALEEATWYGTAEAQKRAIAELARFRYRPALLTIIDAGWEHPELVPRVVAALAAIGDDRARFYLDSVLREGGPGVREAAAVALATIGGRALVPLKAAVRSEDRDLRLAAVRALLPVASVDDLSILHEYAYTYPDDDAATVTAVRESAIALEKQLFALQSADSASPLPE